MAAPEPAARWCWPLSPCCPQQRSHVEAFGQAIPSLWSHPPLLLPLPAATFLHWGLRAQPVASGSTCWPPARCSLDLLFPAPTFQCLVPKMPLSQRERRSHPGWLLASHLHCYQEGRPAIAQRGFGASTRCRHGCWGVWCLRGCSYHPPWTQVATTACWKRAWPSSCTEMTLLQFSVAQTADRLRWLHASSLAKPKW